MMYPGAEKFLYIHPVGVTPKRQKTTDSPSNAALSPHAHAHRSMHASAHKHPVVHAAGSV
jgi:hypothetical protein